MVLTRAAAARLAAAASEPPTAQESLNAEQQMPFSGLAKGRRSKRVGTAAKQQEDAARMSDLEKGSEQADPLEEEMRRFQAELEALSCSGDGVDEVGVTGMSESAADCSEKSHVGIAGVKDLQDHGADKRTHQSAGVNHNSSGLTIGKAERGPVAKGRISRAEDSAGAVLSAGPQLCDMQGEGSVNEASFSGPKGAVAKEPEEGTGNAGAEPAEVPLVPTTRLVLSRKERAARARVLKEALVNVDEKQRTWQEFAAEKQPRKGGQKKATLEATSEQSSGESSSCGEGWVFGKKVAFSFKPKSSSPAKKASKTLVKSPTKDASSSTPPQDAAPASVNATSTQEEMGETPSLAVEQTPHPRPRPTLALTTPAIEAQARSGNPVLDLRFLFPKATPPEPSNPQPSGDSATNPINISPGERSSSDSGDAFFSSASGEGESFESGGAATSSMDAFAAEVCATPAPTSGGFASPFSVESASPALKEILRAAHSFATERGAASPSPSPLNPNPNPYPNPDPGASRQRGRRESYSDVFASPTLVNIFKGARQTIVQKAGPEGAQTELDKITEAAKEYAASRAQLAVDKSPLGVLCQRESELALSFAEKLQLADPTAEPASWGGCSDQGKWGESEAFVEVASDGSHESRNQVIRCFDGQTVQVYSPFLTANQGAPAVGQIAEKNVAWNDLHESGTKAVRSFDGRTVEVRSGSGLVSHAPPPVGQVVDGPKEQPGTLYVVVDTNCYLSGSDMPAVRRIHEAAQSVAEGAQRYEWHGAEGVVIVVPNAVIRELDGLKLNPTTTGMARAALRFLSHGCKARPCSIKLAGPEKTVQVEPIKNGPPEFSGADDAILGCCLYMDRNEGEAVLLTNDVALQLKAMMYGLEATSAAEFLAQRLIRLEQPTSNWAAQMRQVVAMREAAARKVPHGQNVPAC